MQCRSDIGKSKLFYDFAYEVHCVGNVPFFFIGSLLPQQCKIENSFVTQKNQCGPHVDTVIEALKTLCTEL